MSKKIKGLSEQPEVGGKQPSIKQYLLKGSMKRSVSKDQTETSIGSLGGYLDD